MATQNYQKRSRQDSAAPNRKHVHFGEDEGSSENESYLDRSLDHVARVRAAREAAERKMREFGDPSEYNISIIRGQLKVAAPEGPAQPELDFEREVEN